jgi:hypothetical protein
MFWSFCSRIGWGIFLGALLGAAAISPAAETVVLDHAAIVMDAKQPSFVQYGVEELAGYLKELTGNDILVLTFAGKARPVQILVGTKTVKKILPECLPDKKLAQQGIWSRRCRKTARRM